MYEPRAEGSEQYLNIHRRSKRTENEENSDRATSYFRIPGTHGPRREGSCFLFETLQECGNRPFVKNRTFHAVKEEEEVEGKEYPRQNVSLHRSSKVKTLKIRSRKSIPDFLIWERQYNNMYA